MSNQIVKEILVQKEYLACTAECLKTIAHPQRLALILLLSQGEYSVDGLSKLSGTAQATTSSHLRLMEGKGLLVRERRGRSVYYRIAEPHLENIISCIQERFIEFKSAAMNKSAAA